jgi:hypothetical protein
MSPTTPHPPVVFTASPLEWSYHAMQKNSIYVFPEIKLRGLSPNFYIFYLCERFTSIYSHDRSAYSAAGNRQTDPGNI